MIRVGDEPMLECSTKGDKRFSAFHARLACERGASIEELYQAFKTFPDGHGGFMRGLGWKEAKGRVAFNMEEAKLYYAHLWNVYFQENPELYRVIEQYQGFSDIFGQEGRCCQAIEIYRIWGEYKASLTQS